MKFKYQSGEELKKGERVLFHGETGQIEIVATELSDPETDWFVEECGGGVMVLEGSTFIPADQVEECDDLQLVSRLESAAP